MSSFRDCGENTDNRIRSVANILRNLCVGNVGECVRDGESTEGCWNVGEGMDMGEYVGVFQGMGNEFAVLTVVMYTVVMKVWVDECMRVCVCVCFGSVATACALKTKVTVINKLSMHPRTTHCL